MGSQQPPDGLAGWRAMRRLETTETLLKLAEMATKALRLHGGRLMSADM